MTAYFEKSYQRAFGTFPLKCEQLINALSTALSAGYRAFDTAQMYRNEAEVGTVLSASGLSREEFFVTTKVENCNFNQSRFIASVEDSLRKLQLDQVDVLLVHWPPADGDIEPSLKLLEQAAEYGFANHIGVSNYTAQMMRDAKSIVDVPLVTNQVEFHPLLNQDKLLAAAIETGIPLSSYCSVARGKVLSQPIVVELGKQYDKTAAQIVLRWILQSGVSINTKSTSPENINSNFNVMDFTLSNIDMARIHALTKTNYRIVNKALVPWAPEFD